MMAREAIREWINARVRRELILFIKFTALAVMIASCAVPGLNHEKVKTYLLEWDGDLAASEPQSIDSCASLVIISPIAAPGYATAQMAYVEQDHRLDYFATHRWADTPARMLSPLITRALQASGLFKSVMESPAPVDAQLRLESEVLTLRQFFSPDDSEEQLSLKIELFDLTRNRLLTSRVLKITEPADTRDPYGGVVAANRAVDDALQQLVELLTQVLADNPQDCGQDQQAFRPTPALTLK